MQDLTKLVPSEAELATTAANSISKPAEANEDIANGYFMFSNALGALLHDLDATSDLDPSWDRRKWPKNATFATFAAWSAVSLGIEVGSSNRRPSMARWLYGSMAKHLLDQSEIALNISYGQGAIYSEIGLGLRRFLEVAGNGGSYDHLGSELQLDHPVQALARDKRAADAGIGPDNAIGNLDVARLHDALEPYFEIVEADKNPLPKDDPRHLTSKRRAELILAGNLRLVAYEQRRLQPILERNLDYLPNAARTLIGQRVFGRFSPAKRDLLKHVRRLQTLTDTCVEAFEIAASRNVFSMIVGDEELTFGRDLPLTHAANPVLRKLQRPVDQERYAENRFFPLELMVLESRTAWNEWERHDDSLNEGYSTRVDNWLRYSERMSYIANMFRSRQQLSALYEVPRTYVPDVHLDRSQPFELIAIVGLGEALEGVEGINTLAPPSTRSGFSATVVQRDANQRPRPGDFR